MEVRAFKIDLEDLQKKLKQEPESLNEQAVRPEVSALLIKFNQDVRDANYEQALSVGRGLLEANLMPYAQESKFNLCVNIVRCAAKLFPTINKLDTMMELIRDNYRFLGDIESATSTHFE